VFVAIIHCNFIGTQFVTDIPPANTQRPQQADMHARPSY